ncbi:MAG: sulfurtransferase TusA family protein [Nitrospirae bacterium]|nr:sulfurtransferase TusA family protein [Nitrospirota bacterium]
MVDKIEFDICGQICPSTLLIALKEINTHSQRIRDGAVKLSFKTDNRDAVVTIPESASNMGYTVHVAKEDGCYLIEISG